MNADIVVLEGDGIGPEVTREACAVLTAIAERFGHRFEFEHRLIGGASIDVRGVPIDDETLDACRGADAVLLGAVGGPAWDGVEPSRRPEQGLLTLRRALEAFANLRPVRAHARLADRSPLRADLVADVDMVIVRELTGGVYFGRREVGDTYALDETRYTIEEIERVTRVAGDVAMSRSKRLASLDKANVLATSRLWRTTVARVIGEEFPEVTLEHVLIDAAAMHLLTDPARFDVIVTENMFGDIISDEASVLCGSIGMLGSASLGHGGPGLFEPIHGSAPDIAGKSLANPLGAIASASMLLGLGLGLDAEAGAIDDAVRATIDDGVLTRDLGGDATTGEVGARVAAHVRVAAGTPVTTSRQ